MVAMRPPPELGRYTAIRKLGSGGFATVWLARDEQLDAEVAVKVLAEHWADDDEVRRRFLAEGRFLRRVDSPYVIGVHDIGETTDDRPFLVLGYADRGSLADRLGSGPLEVLQVVDVIRQVGAGLQQLHERGVLHRDVKPANVLFGSTAAGERAMLGDLGLGKSLEAVSRLTVPGGTPAYVAPEQAAGEQLDARADQYSLAAVAYAALTGRPPFEVATLGAVLAVSKPPESMRSLRPELPQRLDAAVLKGLARNRADRWDDVTAFVDAVTAAAQDTGRTGSRTRTWVAAALVTVLAGGAAAYGGVRLGTARQWVELRDETATLSARMPRSVADQLSGTAWRPAGALTKLPALLASDSERRWDDGGPGVLAGVLPATDPPPTLAPPEGCATTTSQRTEEAVTASFANCPIGMTLTERIFRAGGRTVRVQVRLPAADGDKAQKILGSVKYRP